MSLSAFTELPLSAPLQLELARCGYTRPTPIQQVALPRILKGESLRLEAPTGSGKTLVFALALLQRLSPNAPGPQALVLSPTRELAQQSAQVLRQLGRAVDNLKVQLVMGGADIDRQRAALAAGVDILVATPGRLHALVQEGAVSLDGLNTLVLDEADRMLIAGFEPDLRALAGRLPPHRQTLMLSATYPERLNALGETLMGNAPLCRVASEATEPSLTQWHSPQADDDAALTTTVRLLFATPGPAVVFVNTKVRCQQLGPRLKRLGVALVSLHGDLNALAREQALVRFANGSTPVLLCTDLAARGIDIDGVAQVINFDVPGEPDTYTHRIGRTARAGAAGQAITLHRADEHPALATIEAHTGQALQRLTLPEAAARPAPSPWVTLVVDAGKRARLGRGDLLGALVKTAGLTAQQVGKIDLREQHSYAAVDRHAVGAALAALNGAQIKGKPVRCRLLL
ncbi:DEAD/DEAH box helicase [Ferrimonas balearica]|uniref:DEAD/DEAH box helicase n=1 Tax=Ferrimonas balearica TaxID=44012 RepID=UPI001C99FA45|nr:DEAD/DEAH box helicase [Ferrimonas balearica]MBY5991452.1 DEAD/DEAH box helicase [Ferrimonas balearica]